MEQSADQTGSHVDRCVSQVGFAVDGTVEEVPAQRRQMAKKGSAQSETISEVVQQIRDTRSRVQ